nr:PGPGW domain-containing protein [uncultured Friedmanniella sp.]
MSPDVEQPLSRDMPSLQDLDPPAVPVGPHRPVESPADEAARRRRHAQHHLLRDSPEDRWRWRAKIRQNPYQLRIYRVGVAIVGTFLIVLGFLSGPLPGPGGIPLVLLGLATWASEFVWAQRLMKVFKAQLQRFRSWSRLGQVAAFGVFFACCGLFGYAYLLTLGPPTWLPNSVEGLLARLPGL